MAHLRALRERTRKLVYYKRLDESRSTRPYNRRESIIKYSAITRGNIAQFRGRYNRPGNKVGEIL